MRKAILYFPDKKKQVVTIVDSGPFSTGVEVVWDTDADGPIPEGVVDYSVVSPQDFMEPQFDIDGKPVMEQTFDEEGKLISEKQLEIKKRRLVVSSEKQAAKVVKEKENKDKEDQKAAIRAEIAELKELINQESATLKQINRYLKLKGD